MSSNDTSRPYSSPYSKKTFHQVILVRVGFYGRLVIQFYFLLQMFVFFFYAFKYYEKVPTSFKIERPASPYRGRTIDTKFKSGRASYRKSFLGQVVDGSVEGGGEDDGNVEYLDVAEEARIAELIKPIDLHNDPGPFTGFTGFCRGKHELKKDVRLYAPWRLRDCGDDAYVTYHAGSHNMTLLAVADGVGGWSDSGVDSSLFSWSIVNRTVLHFQDALKKSAKWTPKSILNLAFLDLAHENKIGGGSSTFCLVIIDHSKLELRAVNVGDSGFRVFRNGKLWKRSTEQQHSFNYPFQLSTDADQDTPLDGDDYHMFLNKGDLIIVGSDGVFDNMYDKAIAIEVAQYLAKTKEDSDRQVIWMNMLARSLVTAAMKLAQDQTFKSPFQTHAEAANVLNCFGGKEDDTSTCMIEV